MYVIAVTVTTFIVTLISGLFAQFSAHSLTESCSRCSQHHTDTFCVPCSCSGQTHFWYHWEEAEEIMIDLSYTHAGGCQVSAFSEHIFCVFSSPYFWYSRYMCGAWTGSIACCGQLYQHILNSDPLWYGNRSEWALSNY